MMAHPNMIVQRPDVVALLTESQRTFRIIYLDGRGHPEDVDDYPEWMGSSMGHWEGDNTLVVDTTGLDENTWLTDAGYPHSIDAHVQERFTRTDHNDLELTVTVDDPKFYTKPFSLGTEYFRWVPDQILDERLCIPSNVIEYLKAVGDPAGKQP